MPDACRASVRIKNAILCPGITTGTVKIDTTFHEAIFKIKHTIYQVPWTYCVTGICTKAAIDGFQSCCFETSQSHLVTTIGDHLLMAYSIRCANNRTRLLMVEAIVICDSQVFHSNIIAIQVECCHTPIVTMFATPLIAGNILRDNSFITILTLQNNVVFLNVDLLFINTLFNKDNPWACRRIGKAVNGGLNRLIISLTIDINNNAFCLRKAKSTEQNVHCKNKTDML